MARPQESPHPEQRRLREVTLYFLRLGCIAFGGPAAHIAIMRRELVEQLKWLTDQEFLDHLGVTNLIPGPNSTELTMHLGARRAGFAGLWAGGGAFILPAVLIVLAIAWAYVEYGDTPAGEALIYGIQPFILAIIIQAAWGLRTTAFKGADTILIGIAVAALAFVDSPLTNEAILVVGAGVVLFLLRTRARSGRWPTPRIPGVTAILPLFLVTNPPGYRAWELFLVFLKIGAVLYGSGYVLIAFVEGDLIDARGWLTQEQLVDAIAVGQFTPGPVFTTATFIGYILDGLRGAALATAGIFLPSFIFVALTHPLVPRLRQSERARHFLDGVNVGALALMLVVSIRLARQSLDDWFVISLFVLAAIVLIRYKPNTAWLVLAGATAGLLRQLVT